MNLCEAPPMLAKVSKEEANHSYQHMSRICKSRLECYIYICVKLTNICRVVENRKGESMQRPSAVSPDLLQTHMPVWYGQA